MAVLPVILGTITSNNCEFCGRVSAPRFEGPETDPNAGYFYLQCLTRYGNSTSNIW